jgi:hypothetical protein
MLRSDLGIWNVISMRTNYKGRDQDIVARTSQPRLDALLVCILFPRKTRTSRSVDLWLGLSSLKLMAGLLPREQSFLDISARRLSQVVSPWLNSRKVCYVDGEVILRASRGTESIGIEQ